MANSQLAKIIAPNINDANFSKSLSDAIETINENFKKLASLPFIHGAQGDSFSCETFPIWKDRGNGTYKLTEKGALLIHSIFGVPAAEDDDFDMVKSILPMLDRVSPIDSYVKNGQLINNDLYFYAVKDEVGEVSVEYLGQYYYFIDQRIDKISSMLDAENTALVGFKDYSGLYQYIKDEQGERFERINMVPSLYYDAINNDICWLFNGKESGISAVGIKGSNGMSSTVSIVKTDITNNDINYGVVKGVFENGGWDGDKTSLVEGASVIVVYNMGDDPNIHFSIGRIYYEGTTPNVCWSADTSLDKILDDLKIKDWFDRLSISNHAGLFIPRTWNQDKSPETYFVAYSPNNNKLHLCAIEAKNINAVDLRDVDSRKLNCNESELVVEYNVNTKGTLNVEQKATALVGDKPGVVLGVPIGTIMMWPGASAPNGWALCNGEQIPDGATVLKDLLKTTYGFCGNTVDENSVEVKVIGNTLYIPIEIGTIKRTVQFEINSIVYNNNTAKISYKTTDAILHTEVIKTITVNIEYGLLPNLQQRFPLGCGTNYSLGYVGGEENHTLKVEEMPAHNHTITSISSPSDNAATTHNTFSVLETSATDIKRTVKVTASEMTNTGGGQPHNNMPPYTVINYIIKCE